MTGLPSYPYDPPTGLNPTAFALVGPNLSGITRSPFTNKSRSFAWVGGELWTIKADFGPTTRAYAAQWQAWAQSLKGANGNFRYGNPAAPSPRGTATGTPRVNGASQSGYSLITDGWTNNITGIMLAGDLFQVDDDLHMVIADANSGASTGPATLSIWPALRRAHADNALLTVSSPRGLFKLDGDIVFTATDVDRYTFSFSATEDPA